MEAAYLRSASENDISETEECLLERAMYRFEAKYTPTSVSSRVLYRAQRLANKARFDLLAGQ